MITDLQYVGRIYKNCGPTGAQTGALGAEQTFRKMAMTTYGSVIKNANDILGAIHSNLSSIEAAGIGQKGWTPAEEAARKGEIITQAAASQKYLQQQIGERAAMAAGGGPGLVTGGTETAKAMAAADVMGKESEALQKATAEEYATGRENYLQATKMDIALPGEEARAVESAAAPVLGAEKTESEQANQNAAASSSWMGLVGGLAEAGIGVACVTKDTLIETAERGDIRAGDLMVGDHLRGMNGDEEIVGLERNQKQCVWIELESGMSIEVTKSHTFALAGGGYTEAHEAKDQVVQTISGDRKVVSVQPSTVKSVLRIRLKGSHTYVSNGIWSLE
ncbi:MAG: hypothetical protein KGL39_53520 [Patescibacteria group bacterium]|nr:hypothetical protein [Patescibacteria group bacterium]